MNERIELDYGGGVTPIEVGADALARSGAWLGRWASGRTVFLLTTPRIHALHGDQLVRHLRTAAALHRLDAPDGEGAKTSAVATELWSRMLELGGKRDSRLVALGGGTVTDLAGFVAGCFLRGIELASVPTTLLGQVDAAIGGKTGINLPTGKNTVGLFFHPRRVICDTGVLGTLERAELRAGLMEVVKMAYLLDPTLFERVEADPEPLLCGEADASAPIVAAAVRAKVDVVTRDPTEHGPRRLLNFGHTLGHAIEAASGYAGLRHGEAVGYGMLFALRLSLARGLDPEAAMRLRDLIARFDLPALPELDADALLDRMAQDKKARESGLPWVLARRIGEGWIVDDVGPGELRLEVRAFLDAPWELPVE